MFEKQKTLTLKKIGQSFMLVESDGKELNMTNVYSMNSTAAWLWMYIDTPCNAIEGIAAAMCEEYDVDLTTAIGDITRQIAQWREMSLIK